MSWRDTKTSVEILREDATLTKLIPFTGFAFRTVPLVNSGWIIATSETGLIVAGLDDCFPRILDATTFLLDGRCWIELRLEPDGRAEFLVGRSFSPKLISILRYS